MMTKIPEFKVCIFTDWDAMNLLLDMPAGDAKEKVAIPASNLQPCEHIIQFGNEEVTYYFLLIIPDSRDKRLLVASKSMYDMYNFVSLGTDGFFSEALRKSTLNTIYNYSTN